MADYIYNVKDKFWLQYPNNPIKLTLFYSLSKRLQDCIISGDTSDALLSTHEFLSSFKALKSVTADKP